MNRRFASWQIIPLIDAACFRGLWTNQALIALDSAHGEVLFLDEASIAPRFECREGTRSFCQCGVELRGTRAAGVRGKRECAQANVRGERARHAGACVRGERVRRAW